MTVLELKKRLEAFDENQKLCLEDPLSEERTTPGEFLAGIYIGEIDSWDTHTKKMITRKFLILSSTPDFADS